MLQVRLLGQFDLRFDSAPVVVPSRAAQSLFAYLLLHRTTTHRREHLAGILWPDSREANARQNLRQELWRLRKALDECSYPSSDLLSSDDLCIAINPKAIYWLDVALLENGNRSHSSADDLIQHLAIYQGELLPGFYDEWITLERERLRALFEKKMAQLLECLRKEQRWDELCEWAERWIALGHLPEPAYRALMVAHAQSGDKSQVAAIYQRCVQALQTDLGVEPSEQTRRLFEQCVSASSAGPLTALKPSASAAVPGDKGELPSPGEPPFRGLQYFDEADADRFFGREHLTTQLVAHLRAHSVLAVVGASGSGKSSLVRAGLIPALKGGRRLGDGTLPPEGSREWDIHVLTPTTHPLTALALALTRSAELAATLADDLARDGRTLQIYSQNALSQPSRLLLLIDQFEELFTLCREDAERRAFIDNLLLATAPELDRPIYLVMVLRADFYAHTAQYEHLREAFSQRQEYIGPMTAEEMRRAIEGPAERGGWEFEPGLVELILREVGNEPGALPLLSHALLETWKRRRGRVLTLEGYAQSGGVRRAIAQTAETIFHQMSPDDQRLARHLFLQLTQLGEGTQDTRRRVTFEELVPRGGDATAVRAVLNTLAEARLVTLGEDTAEVAHEALIREWPALREWLNQDREGLVLHRRLTEAAQAWLKSNRDTGELVRGARLAQALEWSKARTDELNGLEQEFLGASSAWQDREEAEREAQRQRELQAAQRLAEVEGKRAAAEARRAQEQATSNRRLRQRALSLAGALLVAAVLALAAVLLAQQSNQNAQRAETEQQLADEERRFAFVRELSVNALSSLETDPERSILLALQAVSTSSANGKPVLHEAEEALHRAVMTSRVRLTLSGHTAAVNGVAFSPDGKRVATASNDGTAKVWDATTGKELFTLKGHTGPVTSITYRPDGKHIATSSEDGTVRLWDPATGQELLTIRAHTDQIRRVVYSRDGKRLVTAGGRFMQAASSDQTAKVWDADTGQLLFTFTGHTKNVLCVAFSPDGTRVASSGDEEVAQVWDANTGQVYLRLVGHSRQINGISFSPDGKRIVTTGIDRTIRIWDANTGQQLLTLYGHTALVIAAVFNRDGTRLYSASLDGTAKVWDTNTGQLLFTLAGHTGPVWDVALSPEETYLATASYGTDNVAKIWDVTPAGNREWLALVGHANQVYGLAASLDGARIASASVDGTARVWDAQTGKELLTFKGHTDQLRAIAFSPDGKRLVTTSWDGTAKVWDAATGQVYLTIPTQAAQRLHGLGVAYSPDGKRIVSVSGNNTAKVWDANTGQELLTLAGHKKTVVFVAYSPDGKRIATIADEPEFPIKIWDAASGQELLTLEGHSGAAAIVDVLAFSPDSMRLAAVVQDPKVWDATTGKFLATLLGHAGEVHGIAFSPDGKHLASTASDGNVKMWDVSSGRISGEQPLTLYGNMGSLFPVTFSSDSRRVITSGLSGLVQVWAVPLEDIVSIAKSRVTRTLTTDECQKYLHRERCP